MDRLRPKPANQADLDVLVPGPGVHRHLLIDGSYSFRYPAGTVPATGWVSILHRASGELVLQVDRARNPRLRGHVAELFQRGRLSFGSGNELASFLTTELAGQFGVTAGPVPSPAPATGPVPAAVPEVALDEVAAHRKARATNPTAAELTAHLTRRIVGQDEALQRIAGGVARQLRKPAPASPYSALLIGPTGVGKTEAARQLGVALSTRLPDAAWSTLVIDCGELTGTDQLNRVLGAAPGFVGFDQGSPITEALAGGPAGLVFDEVEKAHPALFNQVLLGLLDRGRFSIPNPGRGMAREADARSSVVLMTSNLGVEDLRPGLGPAALRAHLRAHGMRPELVGRMTDVVQFGHLDDDALARAAAIATQDLMAEFGLNADSIHPAHIASCLDEFDPRTGVRGLRVAAEQRLQSSLNDLVDQGASGPVLITADRVEPSPRARTA